MTDESAFDSDQAGESLGFGRRQFLVAAGVTGAGIAAATYFGGGLAGAAAPFTAPAAKSKPSTANDLKTAAFAVGLELLAVGTYKAALDAANANKLGPVPPAGANYVQTAMEQHQAQADKWNSVLTGAGKKPVTAPNAKLKKSVDQEFAKVTDFGGAAKLALSLEETAAATYLKAIPTLKSKDAIGLAGSIQIIDMQHAAILLFVLGEYPVPDVFAKTAKAAI